MTTKDEPKQRKGRTKQTTDLGRSILRRERERLVKEQAALAEALAGEAHRNRRQAVSQQRRQEDFKEAHAFQRAVVGRVAAVLSSEGVNVPMRTHCVTPDQSVSAWTDFSQIYVGYHMLDDVRATAAVVRGLFYHEGGHCRWTVPFSDLEHIACAAQNLTPGQIRAQWTTQKLHQAWNALEDQRMETAVVSDSPRKAGYFVPMVLSELADTVDHAASNWPLMVWRRYLPERIVASARKHWVLRNDEAAAKAIEYVTTKYVLATDAVTMYNAVLHMALLLEQCTPTAKDLTPSGTGHSRQTGRENLDDDVLTIPISPDMLTGDEDAFEDVEDDVDTTDPATAEHLIDVLQRLFWYPESLVVVAYTAPMTGDEAESDDDDQTPQPQAWGDDDQDDDDDQDGNDQAGSNTDQDDDRQDDDKPGDQTGDGERVNDDDHDATARRGGSSGEHTDDGSGLTDDDLREAVEQAKAERDKDRALDSDVEAYHDALETTASTLEPYYGGVCANPDVIREAEGLADELVAAFEIATADNQPMWHEQERRGVLNVQRYITRQSGDMEFFRAYVDDGAPGHDIAVSLLLDYSGSMASSVEALAKVAYGCKKACTTLSIPCTVVLWDTNARVLWDATQEATNVPVIKEAGGTDPGVALNDMVTHQGSKTKHLVIIMTDGVWNRNTSMMSNFLTEDRMIVGLGYNNGYPAANIAANLVEKGATLAFGITKLNDIATYLQEALVAMV